MTAPTAAAGGEGAARPDAVAPVDADGGSRAVENDRDAVLEGWVVRTQSGFYAVETGGVILKATLRGRLKRDRDREGLIALGDRVKVQRTAAPSGGGGNDAVIVERLERTSSLVRRAPGPKGVWSKDVVIANIDLLLVTFSCQRPDPNPRLIDRFLALAEIDELDCMIVITKVDLGIQPVVAVDLAEYERIGYRILPVSVRTEEGLAAVKEALHGRVSAVVGPSGVGKSSMLNAIEPGLALGVGEVSTTHHKGRHTTRVGELHPLTGGGRVADTPGLRELALWEVDGAELQWGFVEFLVAPLVRGVVLMLCIVPGVGLALTGFEYVELRYASGLFNLMRPLGGAIGIALVNTSLQDSGRIAMARFGETLGHSAATFNSGVAGMTQRLSTVTPHPALALLEAQGIIARFIARQAITIAFDEVFRMMCWMFLAALLMVPFARRWAASAPPAPGAPGGDEPTRARRLRR